jgi:hypothetical protein
MALVSDPRQVLRAQFSALTMRWRTGRCATSQIRDVEQLERIATYARSGYFHMGHTTDMFVYPPRIPL